MYLRPAFHCSLGLELNGSAQTNTYQSCYSGSQKPEGENIQTTLSTGTQKTIVKDALINKFKKNHLASKVFEENVSGRTGNRSVLHRALKYCKENKALLAVAALDRLARNVRVSLHVANSTKVFLADTGSTVNLSDPDEFSCIP